MQNPSDHYAQSARGFMAAGDWKKALEPAKHAVLSADSANINQEKRAVAHYEYGRALGVTCSFKESESEFKIAYELDKQSKQPLFLSLTELARLNLDQGKYKEASEYFEKTIDEIRKVKAEVGAPTAFAEILNEYATALEKTGNKKKSAAARNEASTILKNNPKGLSITDRTPYGKHCFSKK